jgi:hypothetical protein
MKNVFLIALGAGILALAPASLAEKHYLSPQQLLLEERLQKRISCDFQGVPLNEAVAYLREELQINITLDADYEQEQALVTLSLKDVPARTILQWMMRQTGLRYALVDGAVYIAPPQKALRSEPRYFKQYDVADIVAPAGGGFSGQSGGTGASSQGSTLSADDREALRQFLMECTGRENWDENQSNAGEASPQTQN